MRTLNDIMGILRANLTRDTLEFYIARKWVRPVLENELPCFEEIDIARIELVHHLRTDLQIGDEAMDVVLSLLDQMYGLRSRMHKLSKAIERQPQEVQAEIFALLVDANTDGRNE